MRFSNLLPTALLVGSSLAKPIAHFGRPQPHPYEPYPPAQHEPPCTTWDFPYPASATSLPTPDLASTFPEVASTSSPSPTLPDQSSTLSDSQATSTPPSPTTPLPSSLSLDFALSTITGYDVTTITYPAATDGSDSVQTVSVTLTTLDIVTIETTITLDVTMGSTSETFSPTSTPEQTSTLTTASTWTSPAALTSPLSTPAAYTSPPSSSSQPETTSQPKSSATSPSSAPTSPTSTLASATYPLTTSSQSASSLSSTGFVTSYLTATTTLSGTPSSTYTPPAASSSGIAYVSYTGDGSLAAGWPSQSAWLDFDTLFAANTPNLLISCQQWGVADNAPTEIAQLKASILAIATLTALDARFILATTMQESTGCVRVITTNYGVRNPGLMQSHNGTGTCNPNPANLALPGVVAVGAILDPCPEAEIYQMLLDGANGTTWGDGLVQCLAKQGEEVQAQGYYRAARMYNGGGIDPSGDLGKGCCTATYVADVANRLLGWLGR